MKIFLDFDDTIFDTSSFIESLREVFEECGISADTYHQTYREIKKVSGPGGQRQTYDFEAHTERLKECVAFNEAEFRQKVKSFVRRSERFLFPDAKQFLLRLKKRHIPVYIVSFGTADFQAEKIGGAGIGAYVEHIIVTSGSKAESLRDLVVRDGTDWFLDDRLQFIESVKRAFPEVQTVLIRRAQGRYVEPANEYCDHVAQDMSEVEKILGIQTRAKRDKS